jgi:hypothetical protein
VDLAKHPPTLRRSGVWLLLAPLAFNLAFYDRLPPSFAPERFDERAPAWLLASELALRLLCFTLPCFGRIGLRENQQRFGAALYLVGLGIYFASWWAHIGWPGSKWSESLIGFTAPAWTASLWLVGIFFMLDGPLFRAPRRLRELFAASSLLFCLVHVGHAWIAFPGK